MEKKTLNFALGIVFLLQLAFIPLQAQNYNPLSYHFNGTPTHGIKIKTNIPFQHGLSMSTLFIEGYDYEDKNSIDIKLNWYVYNNKFYIPNASSSGSYAPSIKLANDNGFISIYIDERKYYNRFNIRAFAQGKGETPSMFDNWTTVDEPLSGTNIAIVPYKSNFGNNIVFDTGGNVGIGTTNPDAKLAVKGDIHAHEVKVDLNGAVAPDYVFKEDYDLKTLEEVENHIKEKGHLPNIPSAKAMEAEGVKLKEMNLKLLEKVEELTLYLIDQKKLINNQSIELNSQAKELLELRTEIKKLKDLNQNKILNK